MSRNSQLSGEMSRLDAEARLLKNSDEEDEEDLFSSASLSTPRKHKAPFFKRPNEGSRVSSKAESALAKGQRPSGGSNRYMSRARKITRICLLYSAFLGLGLCIALPGPTLLDLEEQTDSTTDQMSYLFAGRSFGYMAGSVILFDRINVMLLLAFSLLLTGAATLAFPWARVLTVATGLISFQGFAMGILDTGGNAYCVRLRGSESPPYLQGLHFAFGVGGFLAPLIAEPFLTDTTPKMPLINGATRADDETLSAPSSTSYPSSTTLSADGTTVQRHKREGNDDDFRPDQSLGATGPLSVHSTASTSTSAINSVENVQPSSSASDAVSPLTGNSIIETPSPLASSSESSQLTSATLMTSSASPVSSDSQGLSEGSTSSSTTTTSPSVTQQRHATSTINPVEHVQLSSFADSPSDAVSPLTGQTIMETPLPLRSPESSRLASTALVTSPASSYSSEIPVILEDSTSSPATTSPSPMQQVVSSSSQPMSSTQDILMVILITTTASSTSTMSQPVLSSSETSPLAAETLVTSPASPLSRDIPTLSEDARSSPPTAMTSSTTQQVVSSSSTSESSTQDLPMDTLSTLTAKPVLEKTDLNKANTAAATPVPPTPTTNQPLLGSSEPSLLASETLVTSPASSHSSDIPAISEDSISSSAISSPSPMQQVVSSSSQALSSIQDIPMVNLNTIAAKPASTPTSTINPVENIQFSSLAASPSDAVSPLTGKTTIETPSPVGSWEPSRLASATLITSSASSVSSDIPVISGDARSSWTTMTSPTTAQKVLSSSSQPISSTQDVPMVTLNTAAAKPVIDLKTTSTTTTTTASPILSASQHKSSSPTAPVVKKQFRFHIAYMLASIFLGLMSVMFFFFGISDRIRLPGANQWMRLRYGICRQTDNEPQDLSDPMVESNASEIEFQTRRSQSPRPSGFRIQLLVLLLFYLLYVGSEVAFGQFISAYAERAHLWTRRSAAYVAAAFWGGLAIGRGAGIYLTRLLRPATMMTMDLTLLFVAMLGMVFDAAIWVCAAVAGFGMSTIHELVVSWTERHIPFREKVSSMFVVSRALGEMVLPVAAGFLFVSNPQYLAYFMAATSLLLATLFVLLHTMAKLAHIAEDGFYGRKQMAHGKNVNEGGDDESDNRRQGYEALRKVAHRKLV